MTTAAEVLVRVQRRHVAPSDKLTPAIVIPEVELAGRRIDALAIGLWQSRGRFLTGYEIKVARSDWLHELDQPSKAEAWFPHTQEWYVVAPSLDIVHVDEVPHGWGLLIFDSRSKHRLKVVTRAPHRDTTPSLDALLAIAQRQDIRWQNLSGEYVAAERARQRDNVARDVAAHLAQSDPALHAELPRLRGLLAEIQGILGVKVVDGKWAYGDAVTVSALRTSFAAWIAADRDVARLLSMRRYSAQNLSDQAKRLAKMAREVGKTLDELDPQPEDGAS